MGSFRIPPLALKLLGIFIFCVALGLGCTPSGDFDVVYHRANGCRSDAPENSLMGLQCVVENCGSADSPCALEGDVRIMRIVDGSAEGDLELVWIHDGTTARTARCPDGDLELPGTSPIALSQLQDCRLRRLDGTVTENEKIPTLDEVLEQLQGTSVEFYLELKGTGDAELDEILARAAVLKVKAWNMVNQTVVTSFQRDILKTVEQTNPDVRRACFAPVGLTLEQSLSVFTGGILGDVDDCLRDGSHFVFVTPWALQGDVLQHIHSQNRKVGVFGADTLDGYEQVEAWQHKLHIVYADHPAMYE